MKIKYFKKKLQKIEKAFHLQLPSSFRKVEKFRKSYID